MKKVFLTLIIALFSFCASFAKTYTVDEVPNVQLTDSTRLVSNPDGIISTDAEAQINALLLDIRRTTTCEVAMVLIGDMADDADIDDFATNLYGKWGIGKKDKDNGVLILVAKDAHRYVIRTGYGTEGVLPDVVCARIGRRILTPAFREDNYDSGLIEATKQIHDVMTDPEVRDELVSELTNDEDDFTFADFLSLYLVFSLIMTFALFVWMANVWLHNKDKDRHDKYRVMNKFEGITGLAAICCLAIPLVLYLPIRYKLNKWRNGHHACPNCGTTMQKLDEETDNNYLTPSQDREEQLNSVDYDVWLCPSCGETDIYAYVNDASAFTLCSVCGARACTLKADRVIVQPTTRREGYGEKEYVCQHCGNITKRPYRIPKKDDTPPVIIIPGGGSRGGFGGGGFGGGSFGGGMTGGGGASGSW